MSSSVSHFSSNSQCFYEDKTGTYRIDQLFGWVNQHPEKHKNLPIAQLLEYLIVDTWSDFDQAKKTNFSVVFADKERQKRLMATDLSYPIMITNFDKLIDGVHRIFKAVFQQKEQIRAVFIEPDLLDSVRVGKKKKSSPSIIRDLPIEDMRLFLPPGSLPQDKEERRGVIEDYFPDHLPSVEPQEAGFELLLERPSSPYGCIAHDNELGLGLHWWRGGTRVRDICAEYQLFNNGILALEEQWVPLSWSHTFTKIGAVPKEIILLHLDDHQDMMAPRMGTRLDGELIDYMTGKRVDFLDPESVASAIRSGAIGKGSILTPLIWQVEKIHIRHLTFRPHRSTTFRVTKGTYSDGVLFQSKKRIGLHVSDTGWNSLAHHSNYVVSPDVNKWLHQLPQGIPILLHFDLDYFNNRFDGNSHWRTEKEARSFNPRFSKQKQYLKQIINGIQKQGLASRIINTAIGVSPGFYPAEFWQRMINVIFKELKGLGIILEESMLKSATYESFSQSKIPEEESKLAGSKQKKSVEEQERQSKKSKKSSSSCSTVFVVSETSVMVKKMASKKFEGWKIQLDGASCGFVKFHPKVDALFKKHVTVDFAVPKTHRSKHVGRFALKKAIQSSEHAVFVAHLRKGNTASQKALSAVGFTPYKHEKIRQLCMVFRKK